MVLASGVSGPCVIDGCEERAVAHGMCRSHYDRWRYRGSALKPRRSRACLACGKFFSLDSLSKTFCSDRCRKRFERLSRRSKLPLDRTPNPVYEDNERKPSPPVRAMTYEQFTESDVWASSNGMCRACGKPASRESGSPNAGTPAWIVPPDKGGEQSLANRAIFHYSCIRRNAAHENGRKARNGRKAGVANGRKRKKGEA